MAKKAAATATTPVAPMAGSFEVFYANGRSSRFTGSALTCEVRDGALVLMSGATLSYAIAPGQWVSVNTKIT